MSFQKGGRLFGLSLLLLFVTTLGSAIQVAGLGQAGANHVDVEFNTFYTYETRQVGSISNQELVGSRKAVSKLYNSKDITGEAIKDPTLVFSTDLQVSGVGYEEYIVPPYRWELPNLPEDQDYWVDVNFAPSEGAITFKPGFSVEYSLNFKEFSAPDGIQKVKITVTPEDMELMLSGRLSILIDVGETDQVIPTITSITAGRGGTWLDPEGQSAWWGSGEGPGGRYIIEATIDVKLKEEIELAKHLPTVRVEAKLPQGKEKEDIAKSLSQVASTEVGSWEWKMSKPYKWTWREELWKRIVFQGFSAPGFHPPTKKALNAAVEKGLDWLRAHQNEDGSWDYVNVERKFKPSAPNVGITAQAALAFLLFGYGEDDPLVGKAIQYILQQQSQDGGFESEEYGHSVYETSLAILPLVATRNPEYEDEIAKARDWLVAAQNDEDHHYRSEFHCPDPESCWAYGGWCYGYDCVSTHEKVPKPFIRSDLSNTQFAMMALKWAGVPPDSETWQKAENFVSRCQNPDGGFTYMPPPGVHNIHSWGSMTAAGIWGLRLCGVSMHDKRLQRGLNWLKRFYSYWDNPQREEYFHYYYLWTITRAFLHTDLPGVLKQMPPLRGWYWDFAGYLIEVQENNGSWISTYKEEEPQVCATTLALLVLEKVALPSS